MRFHNEYAAGNTDEAKLIDERIYDLIDDIFEDFTPTSPSELVELKALINTCADANLSEKTLVFAHKLRVENLKD